MARKSAVGKRKFMFDRVFKEYDPLELSGLEYDDDDTQTEKQQESVSKENNDQIGGGSGGSSNLNANLISPSEQVSFRAKVVARRSKTWIQWFYAGGRSRDRKTKETEKYLGTMDCHTESVKINEGLAMIKCVNCILSYLVMFILESIKLIKDEMISYLFHV